MTTADRLEWQTKTLLQLKEAEALSSDRRMSELMAIEEKRQEVIGERLKKQREKERQMTILVFAVLLLFVLFLAIYAIFSAIG